MLIKPNDPDYDAKVFNLAEQAMHSVKQQETYTSPLKNAQGKIINSKFNDSNDFFEGFLDSLHGLDDEDLVPTMDKSLIGIEISKNFKDTKTRKMRPFKGKVIDIEDGYYKIVYEDGDTEDLTEDEVKKLRVQNKK